MTTLNDVKKTIKHEANDLYEDEKKHASKLRNDAEEKSETIAETIKEAASDFYQEGVKKVRAAENYVCETSDTLVNSVKEKPLTSLLIAAAVGWLLSLSLRK